jgi:hypothetical protein
MEAVNIYAICVSGTFAAFFLITFRSYFLQFVQYVVLLMSKYLTYPQILRRHSLFGPWTLAGIIVHTAFIAANVYCLEFWKLSAIKVGLRAANLALINMMPLYLGPHLSFLADLFGISLKSFRIVHRSAGIMSFVLVLLHIFVVIARGIGGFSLSVPENLYGVVVSLLIPTRSQC